MAEVMGPFQAVSALSGVDQDVQVVWVGEVGVHGMPKGGRRAQRPTGKAAVLFEVVGEPEHCAHGLR